MMSGGGDRIQSMNGRVVILTSADIWKDDFLTLVPEYQENFRFFFNLLEAFTLDRRLLEIRIRGRDARAGTGTVSEHTRQLLGELRSSSKASSPDKVIKTGTGSPGPAASRSGRRRSDRGARACGRCCGSPRRASGS